MIDIENYDIANSILSIPNTILSHFGISTGNKRLNQPLLNSLSSSKQAILFVIDGLGYKQLATAKDTWLGSVLQGQKIQTVFPSSTPSALTTFHSALSPKEHGLIEWNMYLWEIHQNVQTIPCIQQGTNKPVQPELPSALYGQQTVYEQLRKIGINTDYYVNDKHGESVYTHATSRGSVINGYRSKEELVKKLITNVIKNNELGNRAYHFVHWAEVDSSGHQFGPASPEYRNSISDISQLIQQDLIRPLSSADISGVTLIITADHGQITTNPQQTYALDDTTYRSLIRDGTETVLPSGGARSIFLNVKPTEVEGVIKRLRSDMAGIAKVFSAGDDSIQKLFGSYQAHPQFTLRLGNIIILPEDGVTVWHNFNGINNYRESGDHGGLSEDEIYVPLIVKNL